MKVSKNCPFNEFANGIISAGPLISLLKSQPELTKLLIRLPVTREGYEDVEWF